MLYIGGDLFLRKNYQLTLFLTLIIFTAVIAVFFATSNYLKMREYTIDSNERYVEQATDLVLHELNSLDENYYTLNNEVAEEMKTNMATLQEQYAENPHVDTWEIDAMAEELNMDIYIINRDSVITQANVPRDLHLDFNECCSEFVNVLDERRQSNELFIDGLEIGQQTGNITKYSYHVTPDQQYVLELGYNIENDHTSEKYNFLTLIDELVEKIDPIEDIRIINYGGFIYGEEKELLAGKELSAFKEAKNANQLVERKASEGDKPLVVRYVPTYFEYDSAKTNLNVVEITYTNERLSELLSQIKHVFIIHLIFGLLTTIILSGLLSRWLARPLYMAFHDSLTGLKNRGAYDDDLSKLLQEKKSERLLILLDIDNFKLINDQLGHAVGDEVIILFGQLIEEIARPDQYCYRIGGDEFVILLQDADYDEAKEISQRVIDEFERRINEMDGVRALPISVSIGMTVSHKGDAPIDLIKGADIALYESKKKMGAEKIQQYQRGTLAR